MKKRLASLVLLTAIPGLWWNAHAQRPPGVEMLHVNVINVLPHDTTIYTQGLYYEDGKLYESGGLVGKSKVYRFDYASHTLEQEHALAPDHFGEGLAKVGDQLYVLTWEHQFGYVFNADTLEQTGQFSYEGQGWGLCHDGSQFIMSNGTPILTFRDTNTFQVTRQVTVTLGGVEQANINELEYVGGFVYANVYGTKYLFKIDPASGQVVAVIDARALDPGTPTDANEVLNGIAYDPARNLFILTGKHWARMYEVEFLPR